MWKFIITFLLSCILTCTAIADTSTPLQPEKAFTLTAQLDKSNDLLLTWHIAPGYYLYKHLLKIKIKPLSADTSTQLGKIQLPEGQTKQDSLHGTYQAYANSVIIPVPLTGKGPFNLSIKYQGCSSSGFCYAPIQKTLKIDLAELHTQQDLTSYIKSSDIINKAPSDTDYIFAFLEGKNFVTLILIFLWLGILLAFTPCVLPMVPILSGIIVGHGKKSSKKRSFILSLSYVSGMAITYALVGVVIALIGSRIQAQLQQPWVIVLFSGLFILLAFSLFGFYELQLPSRLRNLITTKSNKQQGGSLLGVFIMGSLSTLIVSPCVSAPLVGVLAYIGQTGNVVLGAAALFALGVGMGIPLLLIGISADRILPKAGPWMKTVERIFGIMMLGIAIWMLSRMVPGPIVLFLWAMLCLFGAIFIGIFSLVPSRLAWLTKGASAAALVYGIILLIGAVTGNSDPFHPWERLRVTQSIPVKKHPFQIVHSMDELNKSLGDAARAAQPVIVDFYADWCVSCVLMDHTVFAKSEVLQVLKNSVKLRIDLTNQDNFTDAVQKRFNIIGPPTLVFFNAEGEELFSKRIVGEISEIEFLKKLESIKE